jgi:acyl-CoA thioesterase I
MRVASVEGDRAVSVRATCASRHSNGTHGLPDHVSSSGIAARIFVVLAATLAIASCGKRPVEAPLPAGTTVVALGDSLTYGTGASPETSYPSLLAANTGWQIVNAGVPGETAAQGCSRLPDLIDEHRPRLVLVLLGGNDFLRRLPEQDVRNALENCVRAANAAGAKTILLSVPKLGFGLSPAVLYEDVGKAFTTPVIDPGIGGVLVDPKLRADPIHPNADGYRIIADNVTKALRGLGLIGG